MNKLYDYFCGLLLCLLLTANIASGKELKVAMVYRANSSFANELHALDGKNNWELTPVKNSELDSFSSRLTQYDMVIIGSLANYDKKVDFGKYGSVWLDFVRNGGVLVVLDANYVSSLDRIIHHMGSKFKVATQGNCVQYSKKVLIPAKAEFAKNIPLLSVPNDLQRVFDKKLTWAHFSSWPSGWECLVKCPDGKGTLLYRKEGKGFIFLTAWGGLGAPANQAMLKALIENIASFYLCSNSGIKIDKLNTTPLLLGGGKIDIVLSNAGRNSRKLEFKLRILNNARQIAEISRTVVLKAYQKFNVTKDYFIDEEGDITFDLELKTAETLNIKSVKKVVPAFVLYRSVIYPAIKNAIPYSVRISENSENKCFLLLDGKQRFSVDKAANGQDQFFDGSSLTPGKHSICLVGTAPDGKTVFRSRDYDIMVHSKNPLIFADEAGYINKSGRKIFPVGIYHVIPKESLEKQLEFLSFAEKYGYSFVHVSGQMGAMLENFLNAAAQKNVMVIVEHINAAIVQRYKDNDAIFAWNVGDEPEANNKSPEQVLEKYQQWKELDYEHPVYTVLAVKDTIHKYAAVADIIAHDCYPIPNRPIEEVYSNLKHLVKVVSGSRAPFGVIQIHGYRPGNHFGPTRVPTAEEVRNMTYQAVIAGVKGIIFYTYKDTYGGAGFDVNKHPGVFKEVSELPDEIKRIEPYLLNGNPVAANAGDNLLAGIWEKDGRKLLIAVNCSRAPQKFYIPVNFVKIRPVNRSREIFSGSGRKLVLAMNPLEVFVAEIE